ncbi:Uncharacterized protein GBIM_14643 [Gryllus bimaculatus]|nr:Uncharacterized protein GBIM_14643 [Gryllus bimaculatus]
MEINDSKMSVYINLLSIFKSIVYESVTLKYFPPTAYAWGAYCATVAALFATLKLTNLGLHRMFDTSERIQEPGPPVSDDPLAGRRLVPIHPNKRRREEENGIELQVLGGARLPSTGDSPPAGRSSSRNSSCGSPGLPRASSTRGTAADRDRDSLVSADFTSPAVGDLRVDVHRKNSSESGEEAVGLRPVVERVAVHRAEPCTQADHERFLRARLASTGLVYWKQRQQQQQSSSTGVGARPYRYLRSGRMLGGQGLPPLDPASSHPAGLQDASGGGDRPLGGSEIVYPIAEQASEPGALALALAMAGASCRAPCTPSAVGGGAVAMSEFSLRANSDEDDARQRGLALAAARAPRLPGPAAGGARCGRRRA